MIALRRGASELMHEDYMEGMPTPLCSVYHPSILAYYISSIERCQTAATILQWRMGTRYLIT